MQLWHVCLRFKRLIRLDFSALHCICYNCTTKIYRLKSADLIKITPDVKAIFNSQTNQNEHLCKNRIHMYTDIYCAQLNSTNETTLETRIRCGLKSDYKLDWNQLFGTKNKYSHILLYQGSILVKFVISCSFQFLAFILYCCLSLTIFEVYTGQCL